MAECRWRAVGRLGGGHSLPKQLWISQSQWRRTLAGAFLPFIRKKEWKARRASAYESYRNKHKAVSRAVTDMWLVSSSSSADVQCERICLRAYVEVCQINRIKGETVGGTGQDFGLRVRAQLFFFAYDSLTESEVRNGGRAVCLPTYLSRWVSSYCVSGLDWRLLRAPTQADLFSGSVLNKWQPWRPGKQKQQILKLSMNAITTVFYCNWLATNPSMDRCICSKTSFRVDIFFVLRFLTIAKTVIWTVLHRF